VIKRILIIVFIVAAVGLAIGIYQWNKPHSKVENAKSIVVTANGLSKDYIADEKGANVKYLNKAIEVSGVVSEVDKNQDGGLMLVLQTDDPVAGIQCSMRDKGATATKGQNVVIKGFCSGSDIAGVSLTDCVIKQ
jgi:hypothetical protein